MIMHRLAAFAGLGLFFRPASVVFEDDGIYVITVKLPETLQQRHKFKIARVVNAHKNWPSNFLSLQPCLVGDAAAAMASQAEGPR